jgi:LacI family transcriptional regulator/LacI family asc operon transcriptional repressor
VATVSRVINNNPKVSDATRAKVLHAMQEADYVPNAFASGFGRNSLRIVGILCTDVANLYYATIVSLLEKNLRQKGFVSLLCCTGYALTDKKDALTDLLRKRVDALILVGSAYREERDNVYIREASLQVPVFLLNAHLQIPNVFCVLCDEREAMCNSVAQLAAVGCREILYLHDMNRWAWAGSQKLAGYRDGLAAIGLPENPDLIQQVEHGILPARQRVEKLLDREVPFSGILASEDLLAIGAQKAIMPRRPEVPIIGFNNSEFALCCTPSLSSVDNMISSMCPMVTDMLCGFFAGEKVSNKVVVSATLVERETFHSVEATVN